MYDFYDIDPKTTEAGLSLTQPDVLKGTDGGTWVGSFFLRGIEI
jgi:hypothetical protein